MAIQNHPALYSGGGERLNSQPIVNIYAQTLLRRQARDEALDEYERNRINRINEAGLRDQDREGLDNRVLELKGYYNANKDAIRKGNNAAAYEYEKMFRDNLNYISESKDAAARADAFNKLRQERLRMGRSTPQEWFEDYSSHELPIRSEGRKHLDVTKYMSQIKPKYDQQKSMKLLSEVKKVPSAPRYEPIPGQPDLRNEIIEYKLDDEGKQAISAIAMNEYDVNDGFADHVQSVINDPIRRGRLEQVFESNFKTKPNSPQEYAVAVKLDELQPTMVKTKAVADWPYRTAENQKNKERNIRLNAANQNNKQTGGRNLSDYDVLGNYGGKVKVQKISVPVGSSGFKEEKEMTIIPYTDIDAHDKELLGPVGPYTDANKGRYYVVRENGDWEGAGGQVIYRSKVAQANMDKTALNEAQRGRTDFRPGEPMPGTPTNKPTGKKKTYQGLDKNGNPIYK